MTPWPMPANLAASLDDDPAPGRRAWVARLPSVVAQLSRRWSLRLGVPYQPGGRTAWVAPATDSRHRRLVLKVGRPHPESAHEAAGLRAWGGEGAVVLHDAWEDEATSALLLECCAPGTPLSRTAEPEQDIVIARLLHRLWRPPTTGHPFRPLRDMCAAWADEFDDEYDNGPDRLDPGLTRAGIELFRTLPTEPVAPVLLCTDLHAGNVLAAQREPWLMIDPKPYVGDRTYDVLQHMLNCTERLATDPRGFARRIADLAQLDAERLELWLFARCVQESRNDDDLHPVARRLAPG